MSPGRWLESRRYCPRRSSSLNEDRWEAKVDRCVTIQTPGRSRLRSSLQQQWGCCWDLPGEAQRKERMRSKVPRINLSLRWYSASGSRDWAALRWSRPSQIMQSRFRDLSGRTRSLQTAMQILQTWGSQVSIRQGRSGPSRCRGWRSPAANL